MKPYIVLALFFYIFSTQSFASFLEYFGTSPTTSSIGNQANFDANDPANIYFVPALLAFSKKVALSGSAYSVYSNFNNVSNIVIKNSTNSTVTTQTDTTKGEANNNYASHQTNIFNIILPIKVSYDGSLGIVFSGPIGKILESDSGDPELPEYIMYRSRFKRSQIIINYGMKLNDQWGISLGAHMGFQAAASVNTRVSLGSNYGSSGSSKTDIRPSLAALISIAKKTDNDQAYFTFQQEMKSNMEVLTTGDITDPPLALINISINAILSYDPYIFRFGYDFKFDNFEFYSSIEYQLWEKFESPAIRIVNLGGSIRASADYEKIETRNIFIPKLGLKYSSYYNIGLMAGLSYRPTPLKSDFSGAGNSIDADTIIFTGGITYDFKVMQQDLQVGLSAQMHKLRSSYVTKTAGQENGNAGQKIGAPGYSIGGTLFVAAAGIKVVF